jgi:hypothetical protein
LLGRLAYRSNRNVECMAGLHVQPCGGRYFYLASCMKWSARLEAQEAELQSRGGFLGHLIGL